MSNTHANEIAAIVDRRIAHWRSRGVTVTTVARDMQCHHAWPAIRAAMIARLTGIPRPRRGRPATKRAGAARDFSVH